MASYVNIFVTYCVVQVVTSSSITFVTDKPANYPNYDDDAYMKRLINVNFPVRGPSSYPTPNNCGSDDEGRFCCSETVVTTPFKVAMNNGVEKLVVQADFFEQTVLETRCVLGTNGEAATCFKDFVSPNKSQCQTNRGSVSLLVHNKSDKVDHFEWVTIPIDVSCSCVLLTNNRIADYS